MSRTKKYKKDEPVRNGFVNVRLTQLEYDYVSILADQLKVDGKNLTKSEAIRFLVVKEVNTMLEKVGMTYWDAMAELEKKKAQT